MAEVWTEITTQDDPSAPHKAVALGRVYRDNDDYNCRIEATGQKWSQGVSGLSGVYPARVATGCKIFFYKPPASGKVSFRFWGTKAAAGGRVWAVVRFNANPALETAVFDSNVSAPPWDVTDFDLSSLAEGVYEAEVFAGADNVSTHTFRLPAGGATPSGYAFTDDGYLSELRWAFPSFGSDDIADAALTADKGHTQTVGAKWYARDEALRKRPASVAFTEKSRVGTADPTFFAHGRLFDILVPPWADTLKMRVEMKVSAGTGKIYLNTDDGESFDPTNTKETISSTSAAYEFKTIHVNVQRLRGTVVKMKLWINNSSGANTTFVRALVENQGHSWIAGPIPSKASVHPLWLDWPLSARQQGALLHAGWWRRMTTRDSDLTHRQLMQKVFTGASVTATNLYQFAGLDTDTLDRNPKMKVRVPHGATKIWASLTVGTSTFHFASRMKLDVTLNQNDNAGTVILALNNTPASPVFYETFYPVSPGEWGTVISLAPYIKHAPGGGGETMNVRVNEADATRMRITR